VVGVTPEGRRRGTACSDLDCSYCLIVPAFDGPNNGRVATGKSSVGPDCAATYNLMQPGGWLAGESERNVESGNSEVESAHRENVRADIARRVKRACAHLSADEFALLVDSMTDRQLRGERRLNWDFWKE
jgi:hypothetical protein